MEIIKVRLINSMGNTKGCEKAPVEVLKELREIKSKEDGEVIDFDKLRLEEIHVELNNLEEADYLIFENAKEAFEKNFKTLFIGGDHSISYPIVRAFKKVERNPLLVVFDAHGDCVESLDKTNIDNFKQENIINPKQNKVGEDGVEQVDKVSKSNKSENNLILINNYNITNRSWLRKLIEDGFDPPKIILISARNLYKDEIEFLKKNKITWIKMDLLKEDLHEVCDLVMERARNSSGFYVSIDIDCIDPGFAPGVSSGEVGGLNSRELIYFVKRLNKLDNFRGADIVEINPNLDVNKMTIKLGARLLGEVV